jgi:hypothetical protein
VSRRKARKLNQRWFRYWDHYPGDYIATAGTLRAYKRLVACEYRKIGKETAMMSEKRPVCTCGYQSASRADFEQHVLASMHSDEDHFETRG